MLCCGDLHCRRDAEHCHATDFMTETLRVLDLLQRLEHDDHEHERDRTERETAAGNA